MQSARAKVLHELAGEPLLHHLLRALAGLEPERVVVVVGHKADAVRNAAEAVRLPGLRTVLQPEQRGTGPAVACAADAFRGLTRDVLVLYGDPPFIRSETLRLPTYGHRSV